MTPKPNSMVLAGTWALLAAATLSLFPAAAVAVFHPYHDDQGVIPWRPSWPTALQEARASGKPLFIEFTKVGDGDGAAFAAETLTSKPIRTLLRRQFVCVVVDFDRKPAELQQLCKARSLVYAPLHLFLTPTGEFLIAHQRMIKPTEFEKTLRAVVADPRVAAPRGKEKELDRLRQALGQEIEAKDGKKILTTLQAIEKISGLSPAKARAYAVVDQAEEPVWEKLLEAAKLVRISDYALARVALEEAAQRADQLPISREVQEAVATLASFEEAANLEKSKAPRWAEKAAAEYQKTLTKHPDSPLAVLAQIRLRTLIKPK